MTDSKFCGVEDVEKCDKITNNIEDDINKAVAAAESDIFLLLDLDGTILDTDRIHYECYCEILKIKFGYNLTYKLFDEITNTIGMPHYLIEKYGEEQYKIIKREKDEIFMGDSCKKIEYIKNADLLIDYIISNNINYAIVTNSRRCMVDYFKKCLPKLNQLKNWIVREDYNLPKPNSECFELGILKYGKNEKHIIGFENTVLGYNSLKQITNHIYIISEPTVNYNYEFFKDLDVCIINDYAHFLGILRRAAPKGVVK